MENGKKVSVIMGVYNCENTVAESIDSIINQTYNNWELIICDDASTDNTYSIVKSYKKKHPDKIILLQNDSNKKLAYSLNRCLKAASGKYIARMDGDDISLPNRFEKQIAFLESHPEYALAGTAMIPFDKNGERKPRGSGGMPDKYALRHGPCFAHASVVMKKEAMDALNGYTVSPRTQRAEDYDLWFRFFAAGYKGYNMPEPLYKVRESAADLRRRTFAHRVHTVQIAMQGFISLKFPVKYYLYAFKPLIAGIIPAQLMFRYHNSKIYNRKKHIK